MNQTNQQQNYNQQIIPYPPFYQDISNPYQEQSYIENILRLNKDKPATIYMSFEGSQWGSKIFKGIILGAGRDHILLKDTLLIV